MKDFATFYEIRKSYKKGFNQMDSRKIKVLVRKERLGLRKVACGRKRLMDKDDEDMLLKCIEEKLEGGEMK